MRKFRVRQSFSRAGAHIAVGRNTRLAPASYTPKRNGQLIIGSDSMFFSRIAMDKEGAKIQVGDRTFIGNGMIVAANSVEIGSDVLISWNVTIIDHQSHNIEFEKRAPDVSNWLKGQKDWSHVEIDPVKICDKVWIGFGASVLPGVTIGEGAVVGACSVVTKDVDPYTVVAGNPARFIKNLPPGSQLGELKK
jgi:acetyltransferase-like isoleucine patch superfamily enzyme